MINYEEFLKVDIRVGKIVDVQDFPEAKKPMYKIKIDFGSEIGIKQSCGQYTQNYTKEDLMGRLVLGCINLEPRHIGPEISEVLTIGVEDKEGNAILVQPEKEVELGVRMY